MPIFVTGSIMSFVMERIKRIMTAHFITVARIIVTVLIICHPFIPEAYATTYAAPEWKDCQSYMRNLEHRIDIYEIEHDTPLRSGEISGTSALGTALKRYFAEGKLPDCEKGGPYWHDAETGTVICSVHGTAEDIIKPNEPREKLIYSLSHLGALAAAVIAAFIALSRFKAAGLIPGLIFVVIMTGAFLDVSSSFFFPVAGVLALITSVTTALLGPERRRTIIQVAFYLPLVGIIWSALVRMEGSLVFFLLNSGLFSFFLWKRISLPGTRRSLINFKNRVTLVKFAFWLAVAGTAPGLLTYLAEPYIPRSIDGYFLGYLVITINFVLMILAPGFLLAALAITVVTAFREDILRSADPRLLRWWQGAFAVSIAGMLFIAHFYFTK